jgi:hypothetical protein
VLQHSRLGQSVIRYGAKAGTTYLVATHPGLLTSLFREAGSRLGWSGWLFAALGWWGTLTVLAFFLLPLVGALVLLVPVLRNVARGAWWLWPFGSLNRLASSPVNTVGAGSI